MRILACLLLLAACSPKVEQRADPTPAPESAPSANLASQDRDFLERAAEGSNAEIAMGALVDGRASSADVTAFGKRMVADHTAINQQLAAIARTKRIALPASLGEHQQNFDRIVDLKNEEFDREFVKAMLGDHQEAVRLFRDEASGGVDAELKAFAAATLPKIEEHLRHAESLSPLGRQSREPSPLTPPLSPRSGERGASLVGQYACNVCHVIPGTQGPQGRLGPSLAGLATRPAISNGAVRNTPENLRQFITNPQSLNPQSSMPPVAMPDADLRDITAFLLTLR